MWFTPQYLFQDVTHITPEFLQQKGIRALLLDVDNTLTSHGSQQLSPEIAHWLEQMKQAGIKLVIASNNTHHRVEPFASRIDLPFVAMCCKPLPFGLARARKHLGVGRRELAMVGDQLFTDILGARRAGIKAFMVEPIQLRGNPGRYLRYAVEEPFRALGRRRG